MLKHEHESWGIGYQAVAGVDEAGRGPLAGPVVAAAVVFQKEFLIREEKLSLHQLTDSKKITARRRGHFFELLTGSAQIRCAVAVVEADQVDALNILRATHRAMANALAQLAPLPDFALVDGRRVPGLPCPSKSIVRGDGASLSIAAASVLAKVTRDRLMVELDRQYPQYGFAQHKGYGTRAHLGALKTYGPSPCHRKTFAPVRACLEGAADKRTGIPIAL